MEKEMANYDYPIIVIGAGAGGLVVAIGAAKAGKKVLLIEKGNYGGDCTNYGCVPSKALIASGHAAQMIATGGTYGLAYEAPRIKAAGVMDRVRAIVKKIRDEEEPPVIAKMGVETLTGKAAFVDPHTLTVDLQEGGTETVTGKEIVIATGSAPAVLPIPGLDTVPYLTNETVFDLKEIPKSLAVIGGGAIGCELAQAFARLGSNVSILEFFDHIMNREEPEVPVLMEQIFDREGISLYTGYKTNKIGKKGNSITLEIERRNGESKTTVTCDTLLIAGGRNPNCAGMNLDVIDVECTKRGIKTDLYGRTTRSNVWAVGDVAGNALFTHTAENEGRTVLVNLLNPLPWPKTKRDYKQAVPHVTYTAPEVAGIGLTESKAKEQYGESKIAVYHYPFDHLDRAITTGGTEGFIKIVTKKWSGKILGATVVAPCAGEMLPELALAMRHGISCRKLASLIHAYPTYSLAVRKAADMWLSQTILPSLKKLIGR
ncbi:Mercuric reductase [Chlamydiales bacterium SCGC AG-110-P3]|nr:Mercuric reductase [Chlamydiales bacterium SCGC AG-110-P3]